MTTIAMTAPEFRALVRPVMPMVAQSAVGGLEGVRIRTAPGCVIAEGLSSTMAGICVRPYGDHNGFDVVFPINDLPVHASDGVTLELEQTTTGTVIVGWSGEYTALREYDVLDSRMFPNLSKKIVKRLEVVDRCGTAHLSGEQLEAFAVAADGANNLHRAPLVIHTAATVYDPILVTCGPHFAGLATPAPLLEPQPRGMNHHRPQINPLNPTKFWTDQLATLEGE